MSEKVKSVKRSYEKALKDSFAGLAPTQEIFEKVSKKHDVGKKLTTLEKNFEQGCKAVFLTAFTASIVRNTRDEVIQEC